MTKQLAGLVMLGSLVGTAVMAAPSSTSAVRPLVRGVIAEVRHRDPNGPPYEALELGGTRFIASARTARIVGRKKSDGEVGGMVGSWAEVHVTPLDRHMRDMAEGDERLMHRTRGGWHTVAATDEGNGFSRKDLRRAHVPAFVIRRLHLNVQSGQ